MPVLLALASVALAAPLDRRQVMERCAERVIALLHPDLGMSDLSDAKFEWLQLSGVEPNLVLIGSITENAKKGRIARRFMCRFHGEGVPDVTFGRTIRVA